MIVLVGHAITIRSPIFKLARDFHGEECDVRASGGLGSEINKVERRRGRVACVHVGDRRGGGTHLNHVPSASLDSPKGQNIVVLCVMDGPTHLVMFLGGGNDHNGHCLYDFDFRSFCPFDKLIPFVY